LVVPIRDDGGRIVSMYGHRIHPPARGEPVERYLPGAHRAVFNAKALDLGEEIILASSPLGCLTFWVAGHQNAIASNGVEGFTPLHLAALKRHSTRRVLIAYDHTAAGDRGAELVAATMTAEGICCYRVEFPKGMTANDYACRLKPAQKSFGLVLRKAAPMLGARARGLPADERRVPSRTRCW